MPSRSGPPLPVAAPEGSCPSVCASTMMAGLVELADDGPQIVGMDLHRRKSVLVRMTSDGQKSPTTARIDDTSDKLGGDREDEDDPCNRLQGAPAGLPRKSPAALSSSTCALLHPATMAPRSPLSGTTAAHRATHWSQANWCTDNHEEVAVTSSLPGPLAQRWPIPASYRGIVARRRQHATSSPTVIFRTR
jgi:hypothetical protein